MQNGDFFLIHPTSFRNYIVGLVGLLLIGSELVCNLVRLVYWVVFEFRFQSNYLTGEGSLF